MKRTAHPWCYIATAQAVKDYAISNSEWLVYYVKRVSASATISATIDKSIKIAQICDKRKTAENVVKKWIEDSGSFWQKKQLSLHGVPVLK